MSDPMFPPGVVPNYIDPISRGWKAVDAALVSLIFAAFFVVLRLFTKFKITHSPGWDDVCSILALCFAISRLGFTFHVTDIGYGRHIWDVPPSNFGGFIIFLGVDAMLNYMGMAFAKLAVLILLYRIFGVNRTFRWTCFVLGPVIFCWAFISTFFLIFRCRPFIAAWDATYETKHPSSSKCFDSFQNAAVFGWFNIISDFILIILPMPMLYKMQLSWPKRLGLALVFATGGFVCAVSIIRQVLLYRNLLSGNTETDATWAEIPNYIWFTLELNIAVLCGCLPIIHPLMRRIPALQKHMPLSLRSLFSSHSVMSRSDKSKKSDPSKKSAREGQAIELAEEGRTVGKKPSQDSGDETLIDSNGDEFRWPAAIVRKDKYDVSSSNVGGETKRARAERY